MSAPSQSTSPIPQAEVVGYDPSSKAWIPSGGMTSSFEQLPPLDGKLLASEEVRKAAADDFGHRVSHLPSAVLRPGSVDDVARMIRFARKHGMKIGPRGQGHTLYGQSQVEAGIVIDMRTLATVHSLKDDAIDVEAGILWSAVVEQTLARGRVPPVLTDLLELTVGGTLSVGGLTGNTYRYGLQIDNVLELQVVTGEGELVKCSPAQHRDLFEAVLAGLGQCGVIVRATLRLIPAPTHVRLYDLGYESLEQQLRDERLAAENEAIAYVLGFALPAKSGGWEHRMQVLSYYTAPALPEDAELLKGLSYQRGSEQIVDMPYRQWVSRLAPQMAELKSLGLGTRPHLWSDIFVPDSQIESFAREVLAEVSPNEVDNYFPVLFYLLKRDRFTRPLFRVPDEDVCFLFGVLRTASPGARGADEMIAHNRELYERSRKWNGIHYAHAALALSPEEWKERFGSAWDAFAAAKRRYDPDTLLAPGPGIFR